MSTLIAVPIMVASTDAALSDAALAKDLGADIVEFRLDEVIDEPASIIRAIELIAASALPCIATCRPIWEGGQYEGDEALRIDLFERLIAADLPPRNIDIELGAFDRTPDLEPRLRAALSAAGDRAPSPIVSIHDFQQRPQNLTRSILRMRELDIARIHKVAYRARSLRDNLEMFDILAHRDRPTIALAMGEFGLMSRVLAPKFGGHLTFASLHDTTATAPGQPTIGDLLDLYRFRSINPDTTVFGVVGWPVSHSLSPHVHNAAFEHAGLNAVYLPLPIAATDDPDQSHASLKATLLDLLAAPSLNLRGLSVTIPHKENLVTLAREFAPVAPASSRSDTITHPSSPSPVAPASSRSDTSPPSSSQSDDSYPASIQSDDNPKDSGTSPLPWHIDQTSARAAAANTLTVHDDHISIANTDAPAAIACLIDAAINPAQSRIVIIGAGGVGRTLAIALADAGAHVLLANRTLERAQAVADHAAKLDPPISGLIEPIALDDIPTDAHAYINATSLGMTSGPDSEKSALAEPITHRLQPGTVLFDTVYRRGQTPMLEAANKQRLACVDGLDMFVRQAEAQFSLWTNSPAPTGLIERIASERNAL